MDLDLGCVASFLVLLQEGHFGTAARRLNLSPSALTKRMQRLERQVGVPLLLRDAAGLAGLTPAGMRFAAQAVPLLEAARAARRAALDGAPALTVRLGVPGRVGDFPVRQCLRELALLLSERHPGVRLACRSISLAAPHDALLTGGVDVAWGMLAPLPPVLELVPVLNLERMGIVPTAHDLADAEEVPAADFAELPLLYIPAAPPALIGRFVLDDVRPARGARLIEAAATDSQSLVSLLQPGQAVVVGTTSWASSTARPGLHNVRLTDAPTVPIFAAYRRADRREPVQTLVSLLARGGAMAPATARC